MKAVIFGILAAIATFLFATQPLAKMFGSVTVWKVLLFDLFVGILVYLVCS